MIPYIRVCGFNWNLCFYRWDLQRTREQAYNEKLKEKEKGPEVPKEETNNNVESFYPSLDDSKSY